MSKKDSGLIFCGSLILSALLAGCATNTQQVNESPLVSETVRSDEVAEYRVLDPFSDSIPQKYQDAAEISRAEALARFSGIIAKQLSENKADAENELDDFVDVLRIDPAHEEMLIDIAKTLIDKGKPEKALELLDLSLKRKDATGELYSWKAVAMLAMGAEYSEVVKIAKMGIKKTPNLFEPYEILAGIYLRSGNEKSAEELLLLGEKRNSNDLEFLAHLCAYYVHRGASDIDKVSGTEAEDVERIAKKVEELSKSMNSKELSRVQLLMLGDVASFSGRNEKALEYYTTLYERDKNDPIVQGKVALASIEKGDYDFAEKLLRTALMSGQNPDCYAILADLYLRKGDLRQAADFFYYAGTIQQSPGLYAKAASIRMSLKQYQKALDMTDLAMSSGADSVQIELIRAMAFSKMEKYDKALKCFELAEIHAEFSPNLSAEATEELLTSIYVSHGEIFTKLNAYDDEMAFMKKVLKKYPDSSTLLNSFAYLFAEQSINLDEAKSMIERALKLTSEKDSGQLSAYLDTMAWVLYKMGNNKEALDYQLRSLEKRQQELAEYEKSKTDSSDTSLDIPNYRGSIELYNHLAAIYEALGNNDKASECRKKSEEIDKQYPEK